MSVPLEKAQSEPVKQMYEGLERFVKTYELVGKTCLDSKEFQREAEGNFSRLQSDLNQHVRKSDHEMAQKELSEVLNAKMDSRFGQFQQEIDRIQKRCETRIDEYDQLLKDLEMKTLDKISDYHELLGQRPTSEFVQEKLDGLVDLCAQKAEQRIQEEVYKLEQSEDSSLAKIQMTKSELENKFNVALKLMNDRFDIQTQKVDKFGESLADMELRILGKLDELRYQNIKMSESIQKTVNEATSEGNLGMS